MIGMKLVEKLQDKGFDGADIHRFMSLHGVEIKIPSFYHWLSGQGEKKAIETLQDAFEHAEVAVDFEIPRWILQE